MLASVIATAQQAPAGERTWRTVAEVSPADRELIDLRTDTPRATDDPSLPAEPYPFEAPYTAEEIGFRIMTFTHIARWSHVFADVYGAITKSGYLTQGVFSGMSDQKAWEFAWRFLGTDVIHETVRFPSTRPKMTLARSDGSFYQQATADIKLMGDSYPYYRADGGVDCYVVVADRFPDERTVGVEPEIAARIEAQDAAGHLVFSGAE